MSAVSVPGGHKLGMTAAFGRATLQALGRAPGSASIHPCASCGQGVLAPQLRCPRCRPLRQVVLLSTPQPYRRRLTLRDDGWVETWGALVLLAAMTALALMGWWF